MKALLTLTLLAQVAGAWPGPALGMGAGAPFVPPAIRVAAAQPPASAAPGAVAESAQDNLAGLNGIRAGTRAMALIDGQWVAPGATIRGARLISVFTSAAQLRHPDGRLELVALTPQVEFRRRALVAPHSPPGLARAARKEQP